MRPVFALLLCARIASAQGERPDPPQPAEAAQRPDPHWITARLDGITAKLVVRYHLATVGPSGFNHFTLALPDNGVVTGAVVRGDGGAHRLELSETDSGTAEFEAVLAKPAGPRRRWTVMVSDPLGPGVTVDVAAPRSAVLTIDLEISAPTCFSHGVRYASVDPAWRASIDLAVRTVATAPGCGAPPNDDGGPALARTWLAFATDDGTWRPAGEQRVAIRGERIDVDHGHFARVELDVANELGEVPADLHTVFVIDASRSMRESERAAQAKVIRSYIEHAPGTQIQIVAFARKAHALLPAWTRAGDAKLAMLASLPEANGSNVDTGLVEAAAWLAQTTGTRRVVLFGDERLGKRVAALSTDALRGILPAHTLVHVVALDPVSPELGHHHGQPPVQTASIRRDDDIMFAELARDTEGLAARAMEIDDKISAANLVKPIALEHVSVHAAGWTDLRVDSDESACTGDLARGRSCAWFGAADPVAVTPTIAIDGLLWNHAVHRTLTPDSGQREVLARMLTGFATSLGDAEHDLQVAARAVNPAWVLYGAWGAEDGYDDQDFSNIYGSGCGCDDGGLNGGFGIGMAPQVHATGPSLAVQLARATAGCHVDAHVEVEVELTETEIVDVAVTAPRAELRDCVTEAVWNTLLFVADPQPHATEHVSLGS